MIDQTAFRELGLKVAGMAAIAIRTVNYNGYGPANASGAAAASIQYRLTPNGVDIVSVGEPARYVQALVTGRGPTMSSGDGSLRMRIREWLDQKNFIPEEDREGASYAITKSIHKKGTTLYQKGGNSPIWDALTDPEVMAEARIAVKASILATVLAKQTA